MAVSMLASCGGDETPSEPEQVEAVVERSLTAQVEGDVDEYCDSVILLSGRDLDAYDQAELVRAASGTDRSCGEDLAAGLDKRLARSFQITSTETTVSGDRARALVRFKIGGKEEMTKTRLVKLPDYGWRVTFTGY